MIYLQLFLSYLKIGFFGFGGGYAMLSLIQNEVVVQHAWMTNAEFADIVAVSQITPGPIAINSATFVGIRVAGLPGAIVATAGCVLPSCIIVLALAFIYYHFSKLTAVQGVLQGLRPAVVAMIASAGLSLLVLALFGGRELSVSPLGLDTVAALIFAAGFLVLRRKSVNPIWIMMVSGVAGVALYSIV